MDEFYYTLAPPHTRPLLAYYWSQGRAAKFWHDSLSCQSLKQTASGLQRGVFSPVEWQKGDLYTGVARGSIPAHIYLSALSAYVQLNTPKSFLGRGKPLHSKEKALMKLTLTNTISRGWYSYSVISNYSNAYTIAWLSLKLSVKTEKLPLNCKVMIQLKCAPCQQCT